MSFTTVGKKKISLLIINNLGYGDKFFTAPTLIKLVETVGYLSWGMILLGIWFTVIKEKIEKVSYKYKC